MLMPKKKAKKVTKKQENGVLFKAENRFIIAVVLVSIVVFALFIILLDVSITGMVVTETENSKLDNVFFVMTVFGMVLFLGSMLFYYLNAQNQDKIYGFK